VGRVRGRDIRTGASQMNLDRRRPNPIDIHVGNRVRLRRITLGMSQERIAEHLGVSFQQIQKYEKGVNRVSAGRLQEAARALGVLAAYFFEGAPGDAPAIVGDTERGSSAIVAFLLTPEGIGLNRAFSRIKDSKIRRRVIDLVKAIVGDDIADR
jgi:transcriptional regulator with XRE-family HTH domain